MIIDAWAEIIIFVIVIIAVIVGTQLMFKIGD